MNWQIQEVRIENLFNYSECKVQFDKDMTALVVGENLDSEGANSNGAGKSSLFDAITWILWGNSPRGSSFENLIIKRGTNHAGGSITLIDSNMTLLQIVRTKQLSPAKSSLSFCQIDNDGEVETDLSLRTQTLTQKAINTYFGFDEKNGFSDYLSQVYFSNTSTKGFLSSDISPSERQQILERFLNLSVLDKAAEIVKKDAKELKSSLDACDGKIETVESFIDVIDISRFEELHTINGAITVLEGGVKGNQNRKQDIKDVLEGYTFKWADHDKAVTAFRSVKAKAIAKKTEYEKVAKDSDNWLRLRDEWESKRETYEGDLENLSEIQERLAESQNKLSVMSGTLETSNREVRQKQQQISSLQSKMDGSQPCPHCEAPLMSIGGNIVRFDETEIKIEVAEIREEIKECEGCSVGLLASCNVLTEEVDKLLSGKKTIQERVNELKKLKDSVDVHAYSLVDNLIADLHSLEGEYIPSQKLVESTMLIYDTYVADKILPNSVESLEGDVTTISSIIVESGQQIEKLKKDFIEITEAKKVYDKFTSEHTTLVSDKKVLSLKDSGLTYWTKAFPAIKRDILRNFVPLFEVTVNQYLKDLEITERVKFSLEGTTKKGTIKSGFKINVFDGNHWAPFNSYSGGEKSRILVSVGFAMKDLASQQVGTTSFGFLLCDEILDDLDATGIDFFFSILKKVEGQKFIITHTKPDEASINCTHTITATKHNGESTVRVA